MTQARSRQGEFFGLERVADAVKAHAGENAEAIRDALFAAVRAHRAGLDQDDDETFLILRRKA